MPKKKPVIRHSNIKNSVLEDFDVEFDDNNEKETVSVGCSEEGLEDFSYEEGPSINGNNLFNYQNLLKGEELTAFVKRSFELIK